MNRLRRRFRRARTASRLSKRCSDGASRGSSPLAIEALEPRLLLTTVTLPADALGEAVFVYADPEGTEPGTEVSTFNEMRIGTLSGEPPAQDVVVEVLNYRGEDIPGYLTVDGVTTSPGGGPGGVNIIEEIPHQLDIFNQGGYWPRMNALATDSSGQTYGITTSGQVVSVDPDAGTYSTLGIVEDTDTIAAMGNVIDYNRWGCEYEAAAFDPVSGTLYAVVTGPIRFDATGDVTSISEVLVSINLDDSGGEPIGEADPVGQDPVTGLPDYRYSQVGTTFTNTFGDYTIPEGGVTTIVYSEEPGDNDTNTGDTPVFIAYEYGTVTVDDEGQTFGQFLRVAVAPAAVSGVFTVQAAPIAIADESTIIEGLMYGDTGDGQRMLFALNGGDTNELAWIDLDFNPDTDEELIHSIVPYGQNDQEEDISS